MTDKPQTILTDGTPIEDVLEHNRELIAQVAELKKRMREIRHICQTANLTAATRRHAILDILNEP